jgi:LmbE family N-acetylglucosaminyl deacetylase
VIKITSKTLNIVAIFAHPDDLSFSCAGALIKWAEAGQNIYTICVTNNDVGTLRTDITKKQLVDMCEKELNAANNIIGVKENIMIGYPDGGFINGPELREKLIFYIRKLKADRIVTFDPWCPYEVHPDHVITGRMAAEAGAFAAFPLLYSDQLKNGLQHYNCSEVWFMGLLGHAPNVFIDISQTLDKKIEQALQFKSTLELLAELFAPDVDPANVTPEELKKLAKYAKRLINSFATVIGKKVNLKAAEAFYVQKTLPGHFDNFQQIMMEMLGNPPEPPKII